MTAAVAATATVAVLGATTLPASASTSSGPSTVRLIVRTATTPNATTAASLVGRGGGTQKRALPALRALVVEVPEASASSVKARYKNLPGVVSVEDDTTRKAAAVPNDPAYPGQWALPKIGWDTAPAVSGSATIAVLDTGVDGADGDLSARLVPGWSAFSATDGSPADPTQDPSGHGTWVASIAAGATDNGVGIAGVAGSGAKVMPVQVLGEDGQGQDSDVIAGLTFAADHGADVILMAFSNPTYSQTLQDAVDYAWSKGAVVVAATGNDGSTTPTYPAGAAKVVGVSATDVDDTMWNRSNSGEDTFLGAPGVGVTADAVGGGTTSVTGTSASAAIVAGAAALLKGADASATPGTIVGRLARNADPAGTVTETGNGRVNVARALGDTDSSEVTPVGTNGALSGGPFVGPYVSAAQFDVALQGQSSGSTPWINGNLAGWSELETIPLRLHLTNGGGTQAVTIQFDHTSSGGVPGVQDLFNFVPGPGSSITAGPTLSAPPGATKWSYNLTVSSTVATADITLSAKLAAGAHNFTGSSLAIGDNSVGGQLQIAKPAAKVGNPDLTVVKTGPTSALPGATASYTLAYSNKVGATTSATGVQLTDTLPAGAAYVPNSCSGTCTVIGNVVSWDLGTLATGATGSRTLQVTFPANAAFGATYTDTAQILSAENDATPLDNSSSVTTTISFNRAPVATGDSYVTNEDSVLTVSTPATGVLSNDTDADGNTLTAVKVTNPSHGTVVVNTNGTFTYTPTANYNGPDSFTYKANDGSADSNVATVSISVRPVNDDPVAASGSVSVVSGSSNNVLGLSGTDVETTTGNLAYAITGGPSHGTLSGSGTSMVYTPAAGYSGADSVTYTVTDRGDPDNCGTVVANTCTAVRTSAPATVSITVTARGTSTSSAPATATYGDPSVLLTASVSAGAGTATAGSVTFTVKSGATTIGTATSAAVNGSGQASVTYAIPAGTAIGSYTVLVDYAGSGGFSDSSTSGTLTITKAALSITADDKAKVYGSTNPSLTGSIAGIKNGDAITATYATTATAASGVGSYAIVPTAVDSTPSTLSNYTVTLVNGSLSVTKAALTVTADHKSRTYGDANPALTVSYTGFRPRPDRLGAGRDVDRHDRGDPGQRRRHLRDHRGRSDEQQLRHHLRARHPHRHQGPADDHPGQRDQGVRRSPAHPDRHHHRHQER
ncbi:hypothetical protein ASD90_19905 [Terrabacter sp. Root181]|nr:hypothetical protein ASD90_19905 [Terrabacter sp. Root181]